MKWQPIETAPKDKTPILLFSDEGVFQGHYSFSSRGRDKFEPLFLDCHGNRHCGGDDPVPTHWMPLPKPPEQE